jgi:1-acyl-sn-glycerol-3-phosphate acyltransferase
MADLHVNDYRRDGAGSASRRHAPPQPGRFGRAARSACFFVLYCSYLLLVMGAGQRLVVWPLIFLFPRRRRAIVRAWLQMQARATLAMARRIAGVRVSVTGAIQPVSCIVVMNHQSVLDIPLGVSLILGPYPLIPTRDRYRRGLPGISPLARLSRFPFVSQHRSATRAELAGLLDAADRVARGEQSLLIFPEGHRTRDGEIGRFMVSGLRAILARARQPVYCVVVDGLWHTRTFAEGMTRFAGSTAHAAVLGPFSPPGVDGKTLDTFIAMLRDRMVATLERLRTGGADHQLAPSAQHDVLAR